MKKKKSWFAWVVFSVVMGGGTYMGLPSGVVAPVADSVAEAASESVAFDDE